MGECVHILLRHLKVGGLIAARTVQRLRNSTDRASSRFGNQLNARGLTLRAVDRRSFVALGLQYRSLFFTVRKIDLFLTLAF